jgi:hypothetical protein
MFCILAMSPLSQLITLVSTAEVAINVVGYVLFFTAKMLSKPATTA